MSRLFVTSVIFRKWLIIRLRQELRGDARSRTHHREVDVITMVVRHVLGLQGDEDFYFVVVVVLCG